MNALIVAANRYRNPLPVMPLGACVAAEAAERAGHSVKLLDLMFAKNPRAALAAKLRDTHFDLVGFSSRNIDNQDMQSPTSFYDELGDLVRTARANCRAPVVLGGAAMGVMPEQLMLRTGADWAALGDGELVMPALLDALADGADPREVPGLGWIEGGEFVRSRPSFSSSFTCIPPDFRHWLDLRAYKSRLAPLPVQTKRGCPFKCVYCTYAGLEGKEVRLADAGQVADAIGQYAANGFRDIEIVDSIFNAPRQHAIAICEELAKVRHRARLQSLELSPAGLDDELLQGMTRAGFTAIGATVESAADTVLHEMQKGYTAAQVRHAAAAVRRGKLPCLWIFLFGGPGETQETVRETLRFAQHEISPRDVIFYNVGLRVYPGTQLEKIALAQGRLPPPNGDPLAPVSYLSPGVDREWLMGELVRFRGRNMNCINVDSLSENLVPLLHRFAAYVGMRAPLWRHTRHLRRALRIVRRDL